MCEAERGTRIITKTEQDQEYQEESSLNFITYQQRGKTKNEEYEDLLEKMMINHRKNIFEKPMDFETGFDIEKKT